MEIRLTDLAEKDLEEIGQYLIQHFPEKSEATYRFIEHSCRQLIEYPEIGRPGRVANTRELKLANLPYHLVYRVRKNATVILRVYHNARQPLSE